MAAAATCSPGWARSPAARVRRATEAAGPGGGRRPPRGRKRRRQPFGLWLALYALSGFVALSLEILWFRLIDVAVKSTAFTFGTVLAIYLLGSAVGCLAGAPLRGPRCAGRSRPSCSPSARSCSLSGAAVIAARARCRRATPVYAWFVDYWGDLPVLPLRRT